MLQLWQRFMEGRLPVGECHARFEIPTPLRLSFYSMQSQNRTSGHLSNNKRLESTVQVHDTRAAFSLSMLELSEKILFVLWSQPKVGGYLTPFLGYPT